MGKTRKDNPYNPYRKADKNKKTNRKKEDSKKSEVSNEVFLRQCAGIIFTDEKER